MRCIRHALVWMMCCEWVLATGMSILSIGHFYTHVFKERIAHTLVIQCNHPVFDSSKFGL